MVMKPSSFATPAWSRAPVALTPRSRPDGLYSVTKFTPLSANTFVIAYAWLPASPVNVGTALVLALSQEPAARLLCMSVKVKPGGGLEESTKTSGDRPVMASTTPPVSVIAGSTVGVQRNG